MLDQKSFHHQVANAKVIGIKIGISDNNNKWEKYHFVKLNLRIFFLKSSKMTVDPLLLVNSS